MKMLKCNRRRLAGLLIFALVITSLVSMPSSFVYADETETKTVTGIENDTETAYEPQPTPELSGIPTEEADEEPTPEEKELSPTPSEAGGIEPTTQPDGSEESTENESNPTPTEEAEPTEEITPTPEPTKEAEPTKEITPTPEPTKEAEPTKEITPTPEPTKEAEPTKEITPTPEPTKEITPTPKPTKEAEPTEEITPTPKPTKKPKPTKEITPTPKPTKKPEPTKEITPTPKPTKKPEPTKEITPTPKPTKKPKPTKEVTPTPKPTEADEVTPSPTPTIKPSLQLPTESNEARYQYLFGTGVLELTIDNPPPGFETAEEAIKHMVTIKVPVWKIDAEGKRYSSSFNLTIHTKLAKNVKAIFKEIYALDMQFPIRVLKGYGYRKVGGVGLSNSTLMSMHSFGAAIDINPWDYDNDYYLGKGNDLRDKTNPYCIPDEVIEIFERYGWFWGGNFEICADTMHFQYLGLEYLTYQDNSPFRDIKLKKSYMKGTDIKNLQQRLCELGYKVIVDGVYGSKTASAIKKYQKKNGLDATGVVDYKTWETIINETHYMPYAF